MNNEKTKHDTWERLKLFLLTRRVESGRDAKVLSFHLHLWDTVQYMDVLHNPKKCDTDGMCNVSAFIDHMEILHALTSTPEIEKEIEIIMYHLLKLSLDVKRQELELSLDVKRQEIENAIKRAVKQTQDN